MLKKITSDNIIMNAKPFNSTTDSFPFQVCKECGTVGPRSLTRGKPTPPKCSCAFKVKKIQWEEIRIRREASRAGVRKVKKVKKHNKKRRRISKGDYILYINSRKWFFLKKRYKKGECLVCESKLKLCLHHLHYGNLGLETEDDLATLCQDCHRACHIAKDGENFLRISLPNKVSLNFLISIKKGSRDLELGKSFFENKRLSQEHGHIFDESYNGKVLARERRPRKERKPKKNLSPIIVDNNWSNKSILHRLKKN